MLKLSFSEWPRSCLHLMDYIDKYSSSNLRDPIHVHWRVVDPPSGYLSYPSLL